MVRLNNADILSVAGLAAADPRTVRRAYLGQPVRGMARSRIERAAAQLGLSAPPPARPFRLHDLSARPDDQAPLEDKARLALVPKWGRLRGRGVPPVTGRSAWSPRGGRTPPGSFYPPLDALFRLLTAGPLLATLLGMDAQFPKRCGCGKTFTAAEWAALPAPPKGGIQADEWEIQEVRNCPCGSTLYVVVKVLKLFEG